MVIWHDINYMWIRRTTEANNHIKINNFGHVQYWLDGKLYFRTMLDKPRGHLLVAELADMLARFDDWDTYGSKT